MGGPCWEPWRAWLARRGFDRCARRRVSIDIGAEAEWVREIGRGAQDAEALLCARLLPRLRVWSRRHLRWPSDAAEDLAQEALLVILAAAREGRISRPEALPAFALETCRRLAARTAAVQTRRDALLRRDAELVVPGAADPAPASPDLRALKRCLEALAPRAQEVVTRTFFVEESAEAIAASFGATPGNIRVIRHRALRALHDCIQRGER